MVMSAEIITLTPSRRTLTGNEQDAWAAYLDAAQRVRNEYPSVNIPTLRACIEAYERFCFLITRDDGGGSAA